MSRVAEDDAIQVDTYLDQLLASRPRAVPQPPAREEALDLAHAAAVVREALVRFHPSFRFEEELAARLRALAQGATAVVQPATVVRFPSPIAANVRAGAASPASGADDPAPERGWMLMGGAIASGVSLAAGVLLALRRGRSDDRLERLA